MSSEKYYLWFFALWFAITMSSCQNNMLQRDMIKELREIKSELNSK